MYIEQSLLDCKRQVAERLEKEGRLAEALKECRGMVIEGWDTSLHRLGRILQKMGESEKARKAYIRSLQYEKQVRTLNNLMVLSLECGAVDEASFWLSQVDGLGEADEADRKLLLNTEFELWLYKLDLVNAERVANEMLDLDRSVRALTNKALCRYWKGDVTRAIELQKECLKVAQNEGS